MIVTVDDFERIRKVKQNVEDLNEDSDDDAGGGSGGGGEEAMKPQSVEATILQYGPGGRSIGGKHIKLSRKLVLSDGSEVYQCGPTLSWTASEVRAAKNQLADLVRKECDTFEQADGCTRRPPHAAPRKQMCQCDFKNIIL